MIIINPSNQNYKDARQVQITINKIALSHILNEDPYYDDWVSVTQELKRLMLFMEQYCADEVARVENFREKPLIFYDYSNKESE